MEHSVWGSSKSQPAKIKRSREDVSSLYFEEIDAILERRIEETKQNASNSFPFKPAHAGHWIFVR